MGRLARSLVALTVAAGGCQFPKYVTQNLCYEFYRCVDEVKEGRSIDQMAASAWQQVVSVPTANQPYTDDFHCGFVEGFSYWVKRGGDGEPPAVPPGYYWKESYRTPEGRACVEAWFAGYRLGTRIAREGRYREREILPLSRPLQEDSRPELPRNQETLPSPRLLQDGPSGTLPGPVLPNPAPVDR